MLARTRKASGALFPSVEANHMHEYSEAQARAMVPPGSIDTDAYYRKYGPMVLRRCRSLLGDEERARDAMHDVFVKILRYRERLEDSAPTSLLYRIATNVCLNHIRTVRRRREVVDESMAEYTGPGPDPENAVASRAILARLFGTETESTVMMAILRYQDEMTFEEVAREVGLPAWVVRRRLLRLRERLPARSRHAARAPGRTGRAAPVPE